MEKSWNCVLTFCGNPVRVKTVHTVGFVGDIGL